MEFCRLLFRTYSILLHAHPAKVKTLTASSLSFLGDIVAQNLEHAYKYHKKQSKLAAGETAKERPAWKWNRRRSFSCAIFGGVWGTTAHHWYRSLDAFTYSYFPTNLYKQMAFKVALDMFFFEPFSVALFFCGVSVLEGANYEQIRTKMRENFLPTVAVDMMVWPLVTTWIFFNIPVNWQVIAFACIDLFYDSFLSLVQHNHIFGDLSTWLKKCLTSPCKKCLSSDSSSCKCSSTTSTITLTDNSTTIDSPSSIPLTPLTTSPTTQESNDSTSVSLDIREKNGT